MKVMIAGIGGASLGTEIFKALQLGGGYDVYGCDISSSAYGLYQKGFSGTYLLSPDNYVENVISACTASGAKYLIPGGEQPMVLLGASIERLKKAGIVFVGNTLEVVSLFSDKHATFNLLAKHGIPIPRTIAVSQPEDIECVGLPCVIKPATGSGGSAAVFFAVTVDEALIYADFIRRNDAQPIAQEYIGIQEGEYTIGVLSLPDGRLVGSIALRRELNAKLSVSYRGRGGVISSGYSQGYIDEYPDLCRQAESIAEIIGSCGPINVQGRIRDGELLPFEINPRFSASTYLRAMAGFNEVDMLIRNLVSGEMPERPTINSGWYLRSLTEQHVPKEQLK